MLELLTNEFDRGLKYSSICGLTTSISKITQIEGDKLISMFKRGTYNLRPPVTKYNAIWDTDVLLRFFNTMEIDTPMDISMKISTLFMLLFGQRVNTLSKMVITRMYITDTECTIVTEDLLKHSRPGYTQKPLTLRAFSNFFVQWQH